MGSTATTSSAAQPAARRPAASEQEARAAIDLVRFAGLAVQLAAVYLALWAFEVESPVFLTLSAGCFLAFAVHYFCPFALKKHVFVVLSLVVGAVVVVQWSPHPALNLVTVTPPLLFVGFAVALGLAFYGCLRLPVPFWARIVLVLAIGLVLALARAFWRKLMPDIYWGILGAIFMFRMIVYTYEVRVTRQPETLVDFMSYFFCLPNFYFVLFPVTDYLTFKRSFYAEDIHKAAQRGIAWIVRGTVHLLLYNLVRHRLAIPAGDVHSLGTMLQFVFTAYPIYLRVSGYFHIIVGMMHLFGWSLPETSQKYFLASSPTDFWRRINIYWKDFMVTCFYYPAYFRLRKVNETLALVLATVVVFVATCLLHSYQWFWLNGIFEVRSTDVVFWTALGLLVIVTVLWESRRGRPGPLPLAVAIPKRILSTIGMFVFISVIWSLWSSVSIGDWVDTVIYWR